MARGALLVLTKVFSVAVLGFGPAGQTRLTLHTNRDIKQAEHSLFRATLLRFSATLRGIVIGFFQRAQESNDVPAGRFR
jgi:hypothetical protein